VELSLADQPQIAAQTPLCASDSGARIAPRFSACPDKTDSGVGQTSTAAASLICGFASNAAADSHSKCITHVRSFVAALRWKSVVRWKPVIAVQTAMSRELR
jgi:hypothetical protein